MRFLLTILSHLAPRPPADETGPASCPRCQEPLTQLAGPDVSFGRCIRCGGLWAGSDALGVLMRMSDAALEDLFDTEAFQADQAHTFQGGDRRGCPRCREPMDNYQFDYDSGIYLDACTQHGIWLDGGELLLVRRHRASLQSAPLRPRLSLEQRAMGEAATASLDAMTRANRETIDFMARVEAQRREQDQEQTWENTSGFDWT